VVMRLMPSNQKYHYIFTTPNTQRARTAQEMLELWQSAFSHQPSAVSSQHSAVAIDSPKEAINYALAHASEEDAVFIGGSNYLVSEAIALF